MAGKILKLPDAVANQIAAGEVVERPVAVVKELVENSLDAQAKSIEIHFEKAGKALIRVLDDGVGMSHEDAVLALERHATSKIREVKDILDIASFGFRGEALPSIASVSNFTLRSRQRDDMEGIQIRSTGSKQLDISSCGMSPGTEVTVANLFQSVPARRKFMKSDRTEAAHILQMCRLLSVAHPEVAFCLIEDGHEVFRTPVCPDRSQRVREIFGKRRMEDLIPIDKEINGIGVSGLIARPGIGRSTRAEMITFVNLRPVDSRLLNYALIESYHRFLPRGRYPMAFLFVNLPAGDVDVNVHPTKREVRFRAEPVVRNAVMTVLTEHLTSVARESLPQFERITSDSTAPEPRILPAAKPIMDPLTPESFMPVQPLPAQPLPAPVAARPAAAQPRAMWRFCGIYRGRVGLFESPDGLILLNAKSARERILFEAIEASLKKEEIPSQSLLIPPLVELSPVDASLLADQLPFFDAMGFEIEAFGRHMFRVRSIPAWLKGDSAEAFIEELVQSIRDKGIRPGDLEPARTTVARLAAIREARGFRVESESDWQALANDLLLCSNPLLDARGRPSFVEMRQAEISNKLMLDRNPDESNRLDGPG